MCHNFHYNFDGTVGFAVGLIAAWQKTLREQYGYFQWIMSNKNKALMQTIENRTKCQEGYIFIVHRKD